MKAWRKVRAANAMAAGLLAFAVAIRLAGTRQLSVPTTIGGGASALAWLTFLPLGLAALFCFCFETRAAQVEQRPCSRLARLDTALFLMALSACAGWFSLVDPFGDGRWHFCGHLMVLVGIGTAVSVAVDAGRGILAATSLFLITSSYNPRLPAAHVVRLVQPDGDTRVSLAAGAILAGIATCLLARRTA